MLHNHAERCCLRWKDVCQSKHSRMSFTSCNFVRTFFQVRKGLSRRHKVGRLSRRHKVGRLASGEDGRLHAEVSERNRMSKDYCFLSRSVFLDLLSLFFCRDSSSNPSLGSCPCTANYTMHDGTCLHCRCSFTSQCMCYLCHLVQPVCVCTRCLSLDKRMAQ